ILIFMYNWLKPYKLGSISAGLALASLASMIGWPLYRLFKGLHKRGRFPDMKRLNVSISAAIVAAVVLVFFLLPLPISRVRQTGLVQIDPAYVRKVTVPQDATLMAVYVRNGQQVHEGQQLAVFRSRQLESQLANANSYYISARAEFEALSKSQDSARTAEQRQQVEAKRQEVGGEMRKYDVTRRHLQEEIDRLGGKVGLVAPRPGVVLGAPKPDDVGREWIKDQPLPFCSVGDPSKLIVLVPVTPHQYQVLSSDLKVLKELPVSILIPGRGTQYVAGRVVRLPESDAKDVPIALTHEAGGPLAVKPTTDPNPNVRVPQSQQYLVQVEIPDPDDATCPGTLVKV